MVLKVLDAWIYGDLWCQGWLVVDIWMCTSSILNLCAISVDRYLAITEPIKYRLIMTTNRVKMVIAMVWIVSFMICLPPLVGLDQSPFFQTRPDIDTSPSPQTATDSIFVRPQQQELLDHLNSRNNDNSSSANLRQERGIDPRIMMMMSMSSGNSNPWRNPGNIIDQEPSRSVHGEPGNLFNVPDQQSRLDIIFPLQYKGKKRVKRRDDRTFRNAGQKVVVKSFAVWSSMLKTLNGQGGEVKISGTSGAEDSSTHLVFGPSRRKDRKKEEEESVQSRGGRGRRSNITKFLIRSKRRNFFPFNSFYDRVGVSSNKGKEKDFIPSPILFDHSSTTIGKELVLQSKNYLTSLNQRHGRNRIDFENDIKKKGLVHGLNHGNQDRSFYRSRIRNKRDDGDDDNDDRMRMMINHRESIGNINEGHGVAGDDDDDDWNDVIEKKYQEKEDEEGENKKENEMMRMIGTDDDENENADSWNKEDWIDGMGSEVSSYERYKRTMNQEENISKEEEEERESDEREKDLEREDKEMFVTLGMLHEKYSNEESGVEPFGKGENIPVRKWNAESKSDTDEYIRIGNEDYLRKKRDYSSEQIQRQEHSLKKTREGGIVRHKNVVRMNGGINEKNDAYLFSERSISGNKGMKMIKERIDPKSFHTNIPSLVTPKNSWNGIELSSTDEEDENNFQFGEEDLVSSSIQPSLPSHSSNEESSSFTTFDHHHHFNQPETIYSPLYSFQSTSSQSMDSDSEGSFKNKEESSKKYSCRELPSQCTLFMNPGYVIYSACGSFFLPMIFMCFCYFRIYLVASRNQSAMNRGYVDTGHKGTTTTTTVSTTAQDTTNNSGGGTMAGGKGGASTDVQRNSREESCTLRIHRGGPGKKSTSSIYSSRYPSSPKVSSARPSHATDLDHVHYKQHGGTSASAVPGSSRSSSLGSQYVDVPVLNRKVVNYNAPTSSRIARFLLRRKMSVFRPRTTSHHKDSTISIEYSSQMASSHSTSEMVTPSTMANTKPMIIETKFDSPPHEMIRIEYSNEDGDGSNGSNTRKGSSGQSMDKMGSMSMTENGHELSEVSKKIIRASLKNYSKEHQVSSFDFNDKSSSPPSCSSSLPAPAGALPEPSVSVTVSKHSSSVKRKHSLPHSLSTASLGGNKSSPSPNIMSRKTVNNSINQGSNNQEQIQKLKEPESQSLVSSVNQLLPTRGRESRSLSIHSIHFLHPDDSTTTSGHHHHQTQCVSEFSSRMASRRGSSNRSSGDQVISDQILEEDIDEKTNNKSKVGQRRSSNAGRGSIGSKSIGGVSRRSIGERSIGRRSITSTLASPLMKVSRAINRRRGKGDGNKSRWSMKRLQAETKAAKTVGIIVGGFILCWLPFFTSYLTRAFCPGEGCVSNTAMSVFTWLGYCNSAINPIIYGLFSRDFRKAFKNILFRCTFKDDPGVAGLIRQIHLPTFLDNEGITPRRQGSHHQIATTDFP